jgi:hypothetical protein
MAAARAVFDSTIRGRLLLFITFFVVMTHATKG